MTTTQANGIATLFTAEEVTKAFLDAQRADFTRTQVTRMISDADKAGASRDFGDGYNIVRIGDRYSAQVAGRWL